MLRGSWLLDGFVFVDGPWVYASREGVLSGLGGRGVVGRANSGSCVDPPFLALDVFIVAGTEVVAGAGVDGSFLVNTNPRSSSVTTVC